MNYNASYRYANANKSIEIPNRRQRYLQPSIVIAPDLCRLREGRQRFLRINFIVSQEDHPSLAIKQPEYEEYLQSAS